MSLKITLLALGLVLAIFAATAETALTTVSRIRMRSLAEAGNRRAQRVVRLHNDPNAYLSTILTVNNGAVIVATTSATLIGIETHRVSDAIVTIVLAVIILVFCEITPKSLALRFSESVALALATPVSVLTTALRPVVGGLTWFSNLLVRTATRGSVRGPFVTEEELKLLVAVGEREGIVEQEEREMITGILEMTDKAVREVMVPRVDVVGIESDRTLEDVIRLIIEHGHSRIPVYEENMDNIVGVVYAKDVLRHRGREGERVTALMREPYFTPEAKKVGELLHDMQERTVHLAIVVDEYGGTAGIVTIEDLIEEIVGPIRDEYDVAEQEEIQFLSDHEVLMNARVSIDDVKELLQLDLDDTDADSIGGFVYAKLGEIPKVGAVVQIGDATLTVEAVRRQSIRMVRITSPRPFMVEQRNGAREEGAGTGAGAAGGDSARAGD
ncbi:MAG: HlyC/CorC family transporter [Chloroflexi bacterium]|nr:MAG: HlyC/CorC family transporter [Chloroflexota bacterium]